MYSTFVTLEWIILQIKTGDEVNSEEVLAVLLKNLSRENQRYLFKYFYWFILCSVIECLLPIRKFCCRQYFKILYIYICFEIQFRVEKFYTNVSPLQRGGAVPALLWEVGWNGKTTTPRDPTIQSPPIISGPHASEGVG